MAFCGFSIAVVSACVHAESAAVVRKSIQGDYNKSAQAFAHKDVDGAVGMYDPDCSIYLQNGDAADMMSVRDVLGKMFEVFQKESETTSIKSCAVSTKEGVESAKAMVADVKSAVVFTPQGKRLAIRDVITRRDYWEKTDDGWKIKQSRIISDIGFVNGKKMTTFDPSDLNE